MNSSVQQSELQSTSKTALDARLLLGQLAKGRHAVVAYLREDLGLKASFSKADRDLVIYKGIRALVEQTIRIDPAQSTREEEWELSLKWSGALAAVFEVTGGSLWKAEHYKPLMEALKPVESLKQLRRLEGYLANLDNSTAADRAVRALAAKLINETEGRIGSRLPAPEFAEMAMPDVRTLRRELGAELRKTFDQGKEQAIDHFRYRICSEAFALDKLDREAVLHFAFKELVNNIEDSFTAQNREKFDANVKSLNAALGLVEGLKSERGRVVESTNTATPFFRALTSVSQERHTELLGFRYAYQRLQKGRRRDLCRGMLNMALRNP